VSGARGLAAAVALCATAAAGCGIGPGKDEGDLELTVTRDYGTRVMVEKNDSIRESDTVLRVLDRNADITTRYGGGFVQSIDGLSGTQSGGRSSDWFFYVNGIESPIGAAQYDPSGGDRLWWDYRDWTAAMRVPAVVGSWPEPFLHGFRGEEWRTAITCRAASDVCGRVAQPLSAAGVAISNTSTGAIDVEIGTWARIHDDPPASSLAADPGSSGVFARFVGVQTPVLELLNQQGQPAGSIGKGGGLIAALRPGDGPPTWVVTGTDAKGLAAAVRLVGPALRNHYAVATQPGAGEIGVPVP
jgi:uncharacterized protein DUF4430